MPMDVQSLFRLAVADWFETRFARATPAQADAWPLIKAGRHTPNRGAHWLGQDQKTAERCLTSG